MDIIAYHDCKDLYEARKKEQEYFILYNATLNSIEPMPGPKCVNNLTLPNNRNDVKSNQRCDICHFSCFNTQDAFNLHLTQNRHIKAVNRLSRLSTNLGDKLGKEYKCDKCHFKCSKQSDYTRHLSTAKHQMVHNDTPKYPKSYTCMCGNVYKHSSGLYRHKTSCASVQPSLVNSNAPQQLQPLVDVSLVLELIKQNQEFKEIMLEQLTKNALTAL
jgi:hypothetical protein